MSFAGDPLQNRKSAEDLSDDDCWRAILIKDRSVSDRFVYAVRTTGVYCRCHCPSRRPLRKNVRFYFTSADARQAGFRPCQRCLPDSGDPREKQAALISKACRVIESAGSPLRLRDLAALLNLSPSHFHRMFKSQTGVTPKAYASAHRTDRTRRSVSGSRTVTQAIYAAGFNSSGRFYEQSNALLGMPPEQFRNGGLGATIRFAVGECWLGAILVAASERGICAILIGDDPNALIHDLEDQFRRAELMGGDRMFEQVVAQVIGFVNDPSTGFHLPLDIRGTAFQQRVWDALRRVSIGQTVTYTELAEQIGKPKAVRAVASACAANLLAVAIPCHRVIRQDGSLSGYRWGVERKSRLLDREQGLQ